MPGAARPPTMLQFSLSANQPIPLTRPVDPAPAPSRPILALALRLADIFSRIALTPAAPRALAADVGAKLVALLAPCWLAATFDQRIIGALRGGCGGARRSSCASVLLARRRAEQHRREGGRADHCRSVGPEAPFFGEWRRRLCGVRGSDRGRAYRKRGR